MKPLVYGIMIGVAATIAVYFLAVTFLRYDHLGQVIGQTFVGVTALALAITALFIVANDHGDSVVSEH